MLGITLCRALAEFQRELGCPPDQSILVDRVTEAIEWLLLNGGGDFLHEWQILCHSGRFTLPRSLSTPVKYKFEATANGGFGTFTTAYSSYSPIGVKNYADYADWQPLFETKANNVPTQNRPPPQGLQVVFTTRNKADVGLKCSVAGRFHGMDIAPTHNGYPTSGEILTIYHEDDPEKRYSAYRYDEITYVVKPKTLAYVMLSGIVPGPRTPFFLSHFHPDEEVPLYREIELFSNPSFGGFDRNCDFRLYILGRLDPSIRYSRDEDVLPITSLVMLNLLAKRAKYNETNDFKMVAIVEQQLRTLIVKQVRYVSAPGKKLLQNLTMSGGTQRNV